ERGQAMFSVARNTSRPFVVSTGTVLIRVLGTEFDVYESATGTRVAVLRGEVEVRPETERPGAPAWRERLGSGTGITVVPDSSAYEIAPVNIAHIEAWRLGRLEFSDVPLGEAIAELNRYSVNPMVIADPALDRIRISAILNIRDREKFLTILERLWNVKSERQADGSILLKEGE